MTISATSTVAPNAADFQDVYHYALAAANDDASVFCFEGRRDRSHGWTRKEFLVNAAERLSRMGYKAKTPAVKDAATFAANVYKLAETLGFCAFGGISLCSHCGGHHPSYDHAYYAKQAEIAAVTKLSA